MRRHTHELTMGDDEVVKCFVSSDDGEAAREWACLELLWAHAPGIAPRPLRRFAEDGRELVVMERIPGEPLTGEPLTPEQNASLGRTLRTLYDTPLEDILASGMPERRYGPTTLPGTLLTWLGGEADLDQCADPAKVAAGVEAARAWLTRTDVLPEPRLTALGIADLNPANVLWDGTRCRLVDFEDGGLTDPAYDLADHVEHLAARLPGTYDPEQLPRAVGLTSGEQERMRAYRPLWAIFWLAMLLPGNSAFPRNPPGSTETQAEHLLDLLRES